MHVRLLVLLLPVFVGISDLFILLYGLLGLLLLERLLGTDLVVGGSVVVAQRGFAYVSKRAMRSATALSSAPLRGILQSCR